jgi:hypothetical protein
MELFDLPTEIFHLILQTTVSICSVRKMIKLMAVSKTFRAEIANAIATSGQFVQYYPALSRDESRVRLTQPANRVSLYLYSRVVSPIAKHSMLQDIMKDALDVILDTSQRDDQFLRNHYTRILCHVMAAGVSTTNALEYLESPNEYLSAKVSGNANILGTPANAVPHAPKSIKAPSRRLPSKYDNALAAALILNLEPVVDRLMKEGLCSGNGESVFDAGECYSGWAKEYCNNHHEDGDVWRTYMFK